jgi:hypothetical protein
MDIIDIMRLNYIKFIENNINLHNSFNFVLNF